MLQWDYTLAWVATGMVAFFILLEYITKKLPDWAPDWCWDHRWLYNQFADFYPWPGRFFTGLMVIAAIICWRFPSPKII